MSRKTTLREEATAMSRDTKKGDASVTLESPVCVMVVDVARPLGDLDCTRPTGPPYTGAWILACRSGRPLGSIEMPVHGTVVTATELEKELCRQLSLDLADLRSAEPSGEVVTLPRASVVVPSSFERISQLRRCVQRLNELDYPDFEVIVVDNRPADAPSIDIPGARVVREPHPGTSAARNRGIAIASGEIIAFTDDDVVVDHRWLLALGERFVREPEVDAVAGLMIPLELETPAQVLFEQSGYGPDRGYLPLTFQRLGHFQVRRHAPGIAEQIHSLYKTGEFGIGSNMAVRTAVLREVGGFDEALGPGTPARGGEDLAVLVELLMTGHRLGYEPDAIIKHCHRATMVELKHQLHGYGIGFTAMLTAIALRDPRHFIGLAAIVPEWLKSLREPASAKQVRRTDNYPRALARAELRGMIAGPFAYLVSRRVQGQRAKQRRPR